MISEIFYTFLITSVISCCLALARMMYKSKCSSVTCCCFKITRDIPNEEKLDEMVIQRQSPDETSHEELKLDV
jgi:hypothetical protein